MNKATAQERAEDAKLEEKKKRPCVKWVAHNAVTVGGSVHPDRQRDKRPDSTDFVACSPLERKLDNEQIRALARGTLTEHNPLREPATAPAEHVAARSRTYFEILTAKGETEYRPLGSGRITRQEAPGLIVEEVPTACRQMAAEVMAQMDLRKA